MLPAYIISSIVYVISSRKTGPVIQYFAQFTFAISTLLSPVIIGVAILSILIATFSTVLYVPFAYLWLILVPA